MSAMSVVEQNPVGTQVSDEDVAFSWRKARFEELGFSDTEAELMAEAIFVDRVKKNGKMVDWPRTLYWGEVKKALDHGMTHAQAMEIYL